VVGRLGLGNETLLALDDGVNGLLNGPLAYVAEGLTTNGRLLRRLRWCPSLCPVGCELFEEVGLDGRGLYNNNTKTLLVY
jgi:hypothetical protein